MKYCRKYYLEFNHLYSVLTYAYWFRHRQYFLNLNKTTVEEFKLQEHYLCYLICG